MHKAIMVDLDGTLAEVGRAMRGDTAELLRELEQKGYTIVVCSGKQVGYLCGFVRQIDLQRPILAGENGACYQIGVDLPPREYGTYPFSDKARMQLKHISEVLHSELSESEAWYQQNEYAITPFPKEEHIFGKIADILERERDSLTELSVYRHFDCYDIVPACISKGSMAEHLSRLLSIPQSEWIAIGDSANDVPMLDFADVSISVNSKFDYPADRTFDSINDALRFVLEGEKTAPQ